MLEKYVRISCQVLILKYPEFKATAVWPTFPYETLDIGKDLFCIDHV